VEVTFAGRDVGDEGASPNSSGAAGAPAAATGPVIVLVAPQMGENVGAAARAMLNCGLTELRLVSPRDGWPNPRALAMATGASQKIVERAQVFPTTAAAIADLHRVYATTARRRDMLKPAIGPRQLAAEVRAGTARGVRSGVLFGAERAGLDPLAVIGAISKGAAQSWQMENRADTMVAGKFDYGFAVEWMRKDLAIALDEARRNGAHLPVGALVDQFYSEVVALGGRRWDTSGLVVRLRAMSPDAG